MNEELLPKSRAGRGYRAGRGCRAGRGYRAERGGGLVGSAGLAGGAGLVGGAGLAGLEGGTCDKGLSSVPVGSGSGDRPRLVPPEMVCHLGDLTLSAVEGGGGPCCALPARIASTAKSFIPTSWGSSCP